MGLFDSLLESIGRYADSRRTVFDPSLLGDPLAAKVEWGRMAPGGTNFRTHSFLEIDAKRAELRPTIGAIAFGSGFLAIGVASCIATVPLTFRHGRFEPLGLLALLFGIPFGAVGIWSLKRMTVRYGFDLRDGFWWTGSIPPSEDPTLLHSGKAGAISDIHAIQLVAEHLSGDNGRSYESIEANLVFHDGTRRHMVDHGGSNAYADGERLAAFLGVPVWSERKARRPFDPSRDPPAADLLRRRFKS